MSTLIEAARRAAAGEFGVLSTGEKLGAALALNRSDWLQEMEYSIPEALGRVGPEWAAQLPAVARLIELEQEEARDTAANAAKAKTFDDLPDGVDLQATFVTYSYAPGYRDLTLCVDVQLGGSRKRLDLRFGRRDSEHIGHAVLETHRLAWRPGRTPIDSVPGETRPTWI